MINYKKPSLAATIILTIIFFPVGLYLIYKRCTWYKLDADSNSLKLRTVAYVLITLGLLYFFMGLSGELTTVNDTSTINGGVIAFAVFAGIGMLFLFKGIMLGKTGKRYRKYKHIIENGSSTNINCIARMVSKKPELVENELQELINNGYFSDVYIDIDTKEIIYNQRQSIDYGEVQTSQTEIKPKIKIIQCPNCGGSNQIIEGETCECEYCSSPLS